MLMSKQLTYNIIGHFYKMKNLLFVVLLLVLFGCVSSGTFNDTIADVNSRISSLNRELSDSRYELTQLKDKNKSFMNELVSIRNSLNYIQTTAKSNEGKIEAFNKQLTELDDLIARLRLEVIRGR